MTSTNQASRVNNENHDDPSAGRPYHDKLTADLKESLARRQIIVKNLAILEDRIATSESEYFESTPNGNMLTGFDNYIKGSSSSAVGGRRKGTINENDRVFSQSSVSYKSGIDSPAASTHTTPSHAPTPISTSFGKDTTSNHATPTSTTSANRTGAGSKKGRKGDGDDSEGDAKESKKARTNFGATRK